MITTSFVFRARDGQPVSSRSPQADERLNAYSPAALAADHAATAAASAEVAPLVAEMAAALHRVDNVDLPVLPPLAPHTAQRRSE